MIRAQSPKIHLYFVHGNTIIHSFECLHRHSWSPKKESCWLCWLDSYSSIIVEVFVKCFDNIVCQRIFVQILTVPRRCTLMIFVMFIQSHLQVTHPVNWLAPIFGQMFMVCRWCSLMALAMPFFPLYCHIEVEICDYRWNISISTGWVAIKLGPTSASSTHCVYS